MKIIRYIICLTIIILCGACKEDEMPTAACVLKSGGDFTIRDVKTLYGHLKKMCGGTQLLCLTDYVDEKRDWHGIRLLPLIHDLPGPWSKLELFRPDLQLHTPLTYFDLDTAIVGYWTPLAFPEGHRRLVMVRDFHHPERCGNSSIMYIPQADYSDFWKEFFSDKKQWLVEWDKPGLQDQKVISDLIPHDFFQDLRPNLICSFKPTRESWLREIPSGTRVVCFHGSPRPWEVVDEVSWVRRYYTQRRNYVHEDNPPREYADWHDGTLIVLGTGEGGLEELQAVKGIRDDYMIAAVGHAADLTRVDFVVSDHYEDHKRLRGMQDKFGGGYTTHATRCVVWSRHHAVDYWWDWERSTCSSLHTAVRIGLSTGFKEVILCGCPLDGGNIRGKSQQKKDGKIWPPPRDQEEHGALAGYDTSEEILERFRESFVEHVPEWYGTVYSMSGFTAQHLGKPPTFIGRAPNHGQYQEHEEEHLIQV